MDLRPLLATSSVHRARAHVRTTDAATLRDQLALVRIPAPPLDEAARGAELRRRFAALGLAGVAGDEVGNVFGSLPGAQTRSEGAVIVAAHLDTVFPDGTTLEPRHEHGRWYAPGIADNARGLAALLAIARALVAAQLRTVRPVWFVGTAGEEGSGDLRGAKHLFASHGPIRETAAFIALDGCGVRHVVHRAVGSRRLRFEACGPGGHSWNRRGAANPLHALSVAVAALSDAAAQVAPPSSAAVTRMGGGTSVNAIPSSAWAELDLRSIHPGALETLEQTARDCFAAQVAAENARRPSRTPALSLCVETVGNRPPGETSPDAPLVRAAVAVTREIGERADLVASSTDANVPMALGIPAIAIGAGGRCGGVHTPGEWYEDRGGVRGIDRALLVVLAAAGVRDG